MNKKPRMNSVAKNFVNRFAMIGLALTSASAHAATAEEYGLAPNLFYSMTDLAKSSDFFKVTFSRNKKAIETLFKAHDSELGHVKDHSDWERNYYRPWDVTNFNSRVTSYFNASDNQSLYQNLICQENTADQFLQGTVNIAEFVVNSAIKGAPDLGKGRTIYVRFSNCLWKMKGSDIAAKLPESVSILLKTYNAAIAARGEAQIKTEIEREEKREEQKFRREHAKNDVEIQRISNRAANEQKLEDAKTSKKVAELQKDENERKSNEARKTMSERIKGIGDQVRATISDPKTMGMVGGTIAATTGAATALYYTAKLGVPMLLKSKPMIVNETSLPETVAQRVFGKTPPISRRAEMSYNEDLARAIHDQIAITKRSIHQGRPLSNLLFYGPPGTGKTLGAKEIARHSGAEYVAISGADLIQLPIEEALQELKKLFIYAKSSRKPVVVFIDEADALFPHRREASDINRKLTNLFLGMVEKPSDEKLMWIFASNLPTTLDSAILSRVSKNGTLLFDKPNQKTRQNLFQVYLKKLSKQGMTVSEDLNQGLSRIAEITEGWVGRDIEQCTIDLANSLDYAGRKEITLAALESFIQRINANQIQQ